MAQFPACNSLPLTVRLVILTAIVLPLLGARGDGQGAPASAERKNSRISEVDAQAEKELTAKEIDALIEMSFGQNSPELKRPIRLFNSTIGLLISAEKATFANERQSIFFGPASIHIPNTPTPGEFRSDEIEVKLDKAVADLDDFRNRQVRSVIVRNSGSRIVLKPSNNSFRTSIGVSFQFDVDPKVPVAELLPTAARTFANPPHWTNEDLAKTSEVSLGGPISKALSKLTAMEKTAHAMAKINYLNQTRTDGFMLALLAQRTDLRGLPFLMGDECRTRGEPAKIFATLADRTNIFLGRFSNRKFAANSEQIFLASAVQGAMVSALQGVMETQAGPGFAPEKIDRAAVAVATQIAMPEPAEIRVVLARFLASVPNVDATKALANLAIFSPEEIVRDGAIAGLKVRRDQDYSEVLLQGFRYPLPAVSKAAAEALVKLGRKDLIADLVDVLESPDPRLPVTHTRDGKDVTVIRELVRINHHRNCLLCHAPGNTENTPDGVLKVAVPLPNEPLPKPAEGGYGSTPPPSPDIVVRIDMTYLRQDFSVMMPVADADPWPEMQRFDFLVRTRELSPAEAKTYREEPEPGRLSPYHRAALYGLRELTGRDTEPTAAAWRALLKLPRNGKGNAKGTS